MKRILFCLLGCIVVLATTYCVLRVYFSIDVFDRSGWYAENGEWHYLDYFGRPKTGWQEIDGKSYYFAPENGTMVTGWYPIDDSQHYFHEDGVPAAGWLQIDGKQYYLGNDGAVVKGWLQQDGKRYYLDNDGVVTTGWLELDGKHYYLTQEGYTVSGWNELDGVRYQFSEDGSTVVGWFEDASGKYFFGDDGRPCNGWLDWEQKRYYLKEDGAVTTGWLTLEEDLYYFLPDGRMAIGEVEIDGVSKFFTSNGKAVLMTNPWHPVPEDYSIDLIDFRGYRIDRNIQEPLQQMLSDCRAAGHYYTIKSAYRSKATQQWLWDDRVAQHMAEGMSRTQAVAYTSQTVAVPGHSEHQTGLALDISGGQAMYDWLAEHCWDYGFILRYPDDRVDITGIVYEPWHFRYVGTELSLELEALGLCMEEYMDMLTEEQKNIT